MSAPREVKATGVAADAGGTVTSAPLS